MISMNNQASPLPPRKATWRFLPFLLPILILLSSVCMYGQRQSSRGARQHYEKGVQLLEKQQFDQAIAELLTATKLNPKLADAQIALGLARARKGEIKAAGESFRKAIQIDPTLYEAQ